jgi:hypothetical protein
LLVDLLGTEVEHLDEIALASKVAEHHVRWLDVAMHDPEGVRFHQRLEHLRADAGHARSRQGALVSNTCSANGHARAPRDAGCRARFDQNHKA